MAALLLYTLMAAVLLASRIHLTTAASGAQRLHRGAEPPMGAGRRARLAERQHQATGSADPPPSWITVNPLRDLKPLPKIHYNNQGIDGSYLTKAGHGAPGTSLEMMVDYARITGAFPALLDTAGTLETSVEICVNASKLHPTGRLPILQVGGSPWFNVHGGDAAMNRTIESPEVEKWRKQFATTKSLLAAANAKLGSNVVIGCAAFDVESFSWSPNYAGVPGKQEIIDGIRCEQHPSLCATFIVAYHSPSSGQKSVNIGKQNACICQAQVRADLQRYQGSPARRKGDLLRLRGKLLAANGEHGRLF